MQAISVSSRRSLSKRSIGWTAVSLLFRDSERTTGHAQEATADLPHPVHRIPAHFQGFATPNSGKARVPSLDLALHRSQKSPGSGSEVPATDQIAAIDHYQVTVQSQLAVIA